MRETEHRAAPPMPPCKEAKEPHVLIIVVRERLSTTHAPAEPSVRLHDFSSEETCKAAMDMINRLTSTSLLDGSSTPDPLVSMGYVKK